jgi:guanylate kinase
LTRTSTAFPIVVSGPSGAGKTTLVDRLLVADPLVRRSISTTTRPPRPGEQNGQDYFFVDRAEFEVLKASDMIEWAEVHGELYGTRRAFVTSQLAAGRDVLLNIDTQGADRVKRMFPGAVMVFILPPSLADLERRLRGRGDVSPAELQVRLTNARAEIASSVRYDYLVVNDDVERAGGELRAVVAAERCRRVRKSRDFLDRLSR